VFKNQNKDHWNSMCTAGRGWFWRFVWFCGFGSFLTKKMVEIFQPFDKRRVDECRENLKVVVDKIGKERIANRSGKYINGDEISIEDIAVCALLGPVVMPDNYCEGRGIIETQ